MINGDVLCVGHRFNPSRAVCLGLFDGYSFISTKNCFNYIVLCCLMSSVVYLANLKSFTGITFIPFIIRVTWFLLCKSCLSENSENITHLILLLLIKLSL